MLNDIRKDATERMKKSVDSLGHEFAKIRTGRAHTNLLDHISVNYYGTDVPLNQAAKVVVEDARTLSVTPFEKTMVQPIEKAIMTSDLGLNPTTAGSVIRIPMPALTEERRRELIKVAKQAAENARVAIRNIRRDANHNIKDLLKEKMISEDNERHAEDDVQKLTDKYIALVEELLAEKEKDLMSI